MAMDAERNVVDTRHVALQVAKQFIEFGRDRVADRIRDVYRLRAGRDGCADDLGQV